MMCLFVVHAKTNMLKILTDDWENYTIKSKAYKRSEYI